ncbi:hypothetical protein ACA910_000883 [Epithemia clementina (nom. ined.)]
MTTNPIPKDKSINNHHNHSKTILPAFPEKPTLGFLAAHFVSFLLLAICVKSCFGFGANVETALAFYGTYHRDPFNQLIHFVGVPVILWTLLVATASLVLPGSLILKIPGIAPHYFSMATLWALLYATFYPCVDLVGAILFSPLLYMFYATAVQWTASDQAIAAAARESKDKAPSWMGTGKLLRLSCLFHFLSWYVQIHPGHRILEGASPAALANLGGALVAAPLFAFYEGVWFVGLRQGLHARIQELIAEYTANLCSQGAAMRVCESL